jgi:adenylate cyclase
MTHTRLVMVFTDIVGSTALQERFGDEEWLLLLRAHNTVIRSEVERHGGHELKFLGDGFLLAFDAEQDALDCAVAIQRGLATLREAGLPEIRVRIGVHVGRALPADGEVIGLDVSVACRLTALAHGGEILVSSAVRSALGRARDALLGPGRTVSLRGCTRLVEVFSVAWSERTAAPPLASAMVAQ